MLLFICSCENNNWINNNKSYEYIISIYHDKKNEIVDTVSITNRKIFVLSDLPNFDDEDYYFLGYSINNDDEYINSKDEYQIESDITIYAKFAISKTIFEIGDIGKVEITANDNITSKEEYVQCTVSISDNNYTLDQTEANIRLRGNSSLVVDKKSYKLKFNEKYDVFGMGNDKEWALIANYYDPSHLRNFYAYRLALAMEMEYAVECKFVNVFLNGEAQGLYLFVETIKTSKNRVNIEDGYDVNNNEIPFLLELDYKLEENDPNYMDKVNEEFFLLDNSIYNGKAYQFATKYPKTFTEEHITPSQFQYIKDYMHNVYESARNLTYDEFIDVDSFIDYYLIQELFMNIDMDYSSVFMYKPFGEKLHMGPVWDFDISSGNCAYVGNYDPYHKMSEVNYGSYIFNTLMQDPKFHSKFLERLNELNKYIIPDMINSFNINFSTIRNYAKNDNLIWNNLNQENWVRPNHLVELSYEEQVNYLKNYLHEHYNWMKNNM